MALSPKRPAGVAHPPFDEVADLRKQVSLADDFIYNMNGTLDDTLTTGIGALNWLVTDVAGAGDSDVDLVSTAATVQGHPGVVQLNTGPTTPAANDEGSLFLSHADAFILGDAGDEGVYGMAIVRLPSVTSAEFYFGLFDANNAAGRGVNSVCFEFDASVAAYWQPVVVDGSTETAVTLAADEQVTVAIDTWYTLELLAHEDSCQFWVNGQYLGEETGANIPDDEGLTFGFKVTTETTAEKSVLIDAFAARVGVSRTGF